MDKNLNEHKKHLIKIFFTVFIILSLFIYTAFSFLHKKSENKYLTQTTQTYTRAYHTVYEQYKELSHVLYTGFLNLGDIKNILIKEQSADLNTRNKLRKELYERLKKRYHTLKSKHIESFNLRLSDGTIFLKMKKPNKYGTKASKKRHTIDYVDNNKKPIDSFEVGKNGSGFRFVYPVIEEEKYLGSMTFTFNAAAITSGIMKQYYVLSNFYTKSDLFDKKFIKKKPELYKQSHYPHYLYNMKVLNELKKVSRKDMSTLKPSQTSTDMIYNNSQKKAPSSIYLEDIKMIVTTIPVRHKITNNEDAFLTVRSKGVGLNIINKNYFIMLILTILLTILILYVIYQQKIKNIADHITLKETMQKDRQLLEQAKMAQMGEMIGNIAHQWRQPLSVISTAASGVKFKSDYNTLEKEELAVFMDNIIKNTQYLSNTIDTFRDFIKETHKKEDVILQDKISETLEIISATLNSNHIKVIDKIDYINPITVNIINSALPQVLMNLINNAKDIMVERDIEDKWIEIDLKENNDDIIISIEDNGGGVPQDIIDKIFDPYFTTKHQSQGTGLGLYMSKEIVQKHLLGKLDIKNTTHGAKFFIKIPKNKQREDI